MWATRRQTVREGMSEQTVVLIERVGSTDPNTFVETHTNLWPTLHILSFFESGV